MEKAKKLVRTRWSETLLARTAARRHSHALDRGDIELLELLQAEAERVAEEARELAGEVPY